MRIRRQRLPRVDSRIETPRPPRAPPRDLRASGVALQHFHEERWETITCIQCVCKAVHGSRAGLLGQLLQGRPNGVQATRESMFTIILNAQRDVVTLLLTFSFEPINVRIDAIRPAVLLLGCISAQAG